MGVKETKSRLRAYQPSSVDRRISSLSPQGQTSSLLVVNSSLVDARTTILLYVFEQQKSYRARRRRRFDGRQFENTIDYST